MKKALQESLEFPHAIDWALFRWRGLFKEKPICLNKPRA